MYFLPRNHKENKVLKCNSRFYKMQKFV